MPVAGTDAARPASADASGDDAVVGDELRGRYDAWAPRYDVETAQLGWCAPARIHAALAEVSPPMPHLRVLDLGVGTGQASRPYLDVGAAVTGLDLAPAMLERAAALRPGFFRLVEHDLERPLEAAGVAAASFDLVVGCGVVHFVRDLSGLLRGCARALAPGGVLAFTYVPPQSRPFSAATQVRAPASVEAEVTSLGLECLSHERFVAYEQAPSGVEEGTKAVRYQLLVARDPRPRAPLDGALSRIDKTACVDRSRVEAVAGTTPLRLSAPPRVEAGSGEGLASGDPSSRHGLVDALAAQVSTGRVSLIALAEALARALHGVPGRADPKPGQARTDVLAVFAHPDDESIYAGATLSALAAAGHRVRLFSLTDGAGGRGVDHRGRDALARRRRGELAAAADELGLIDVDVRDFPDFGKYRDPQRRSPVTAADTLARWGVEATVKAIAGALARHRPRVVLTFDATRDPNYSLHGHHLAVGAAVAVAAARAGDPTLEALWTAVAPAEVGPDGVRVTAAADPHKRAAIARHVSQGFSSARLLEALDRGEAPDEGWNPLWIAANRRDDLDDADGIARLAGRPAWTARLGEGGVAAAALRGDATARAVLAWPGPPASLADGGARGEIHVVTGQQVGVFGGPALTLVKAAAALALARRLGGRASFWMATHDHDLDEVSSLWVPHDGGLGRRRLTVALPRAVRGGPVGAAVLGPEIERALDELARALRPLPHAEPALALARDAYRPGATLAGAFAALLGALLPGLQVTDPTAPALARDIAAPLRAAIEGPREVLDALERRRQLLVEHGWPAPVDRGEGTLPVFVADEQGRRRPLRWLEGETFDLGGTITRRAALLEALDHRPADFSPDVLTRPLVQDAALSASHYIAGPGELAYLAQATALHGLLGVPPAQAWPRPRVTLLDHEAANALEHWPSLRPAALTGAAGARIALETALRSARDGDPAIAHLRTALLALRRTRAALVDATAGAGIGAPLDEGTAARLRHLAAALAPVERGLARRADEVGARTRAVLAAVGAGTGLAELLEREVARHLAAPAHRPPSRRPIGRVVRSLVRVERAVARALPEADLQARRVREQVAPRGLPQDRVASVIEWVARIGPGVGEALVDALGRRRPTDLLDRRIAWTAPQLEVGE